MGGECGVCGCGEVCVGVGRCVCVWGGVCGCGEVGVSVGRWVWVWRGGVSVGVGKWWVWELGVGVMWEGVGMGSGYGACEDRGCGNVGSVQVVSTHTLICYIDHPSTVHSIGQI